MIRTIFDGKLPGAKVPLTFDFTSELAAGETIGTKSVGATVYSGTDPVPSGIISGSASSSGQKVTQNVSGGVLGVTYMMLCTITTSAGQTLQQAGFLSIVPPTI